MTDRSNKFIAGLFSFLAITILAICTCTASWLAGVYYLQTQANSRQSALVQATETSRANLPEASPTASSESEVQGTAPVLPGDPAVEPDAAQTGSLEAAPLADPAQETLATLENTLVPANDLVALAQLLNPGLVIPDPPTASPPSGDTLPPGSTLPLQIGARQSFWLMDTDTNENFQVQADLVYLNDNLYFWVEDGVDYNLTDLKRLADAFDETIFPTNRQFFGEEWSPGIDGDPRLHVLYASGIGASIAGYFSSTDEFPSQVNEFSNMREMFLINADTASLTADYTYGTLAHEHQHMIHWFQDRNEETWMNEGFSELATLLNGYAVGNNDHLFIDNTDIQLTDWPAEPDPAHYGAVFLFLTYFLDRFGEAATQAVVANPANGLQSIDQALADIEARDEISGEPITADDVFIDWAVANTLQDRRVGDGRYSYTIYPTAPQAGETETLRTCPTGREMRQVTQYGTDYISLRCRGNYILNFSGQSLVKLLPTEAHSGKYMLWSNQGDESDMTLTRAFDFSQVSGALNLNYWTWYDIEEGYDQLYFFSSEDGGETWQIRTTPSGTIKDYSGYGLGWAYTGQSGGDPFEPRWIQEQVDLSDLAGKEVLLRFEYVTDTAAFGDGFVLDDLEIPQIGYATDFESDQGGWEAQGFARVQNALPQTFRLALIEKGDNTQVSLYSVSGDKSLDIPIQIGGAIDEVILVVSGTTRITRQPANYSFQIKR